MIVLWLKSTYCWLKEQLQTVWSRWQGQGSGVLEGIAGKIGGFFTSPLNDTEYALLKRVSGIMGTAVALYLTLAAGLNAALPVFGLCLLLAWGLFLINRPGQVKTEN